MKQKLRSSNRPPRLICAGDITPWRQFFHEKVCIHHKQKFANIIFNDIFKMQIKSNINKYKQLMINTYKRPKKCKRKHDEVANSYIFIYFYKKNP